MIDLKKDLYIMYKYNPDTVSGDTPYIGSYSGMSKQYVQTKMDEIQEDHLLQFATPDALRKMLKDKTSIEFTFTHVNGQQVKTICTKIESEKGIPTKVICATVPYTADKLLKVKAFGNFDVFDENNCRIVFKRKQAKELLAYLIDKQGYPETKCQGLFSTPTIHCMKKSHCRFLHNGSKVIFYSLLITGKLVPKLKVYY